MRQTTNDIFTVVKNFYTAEHNHCDKKQNFLIMNESVSANSTQSETEALSMVYGFMWFTVVTGILVYIPILYKKVRCKFPITVNCWFCNKYTQVPYNDANCWDCPHCEQYNGFNQDGGYNKVIQEQHSPSLNTKVFNSFAKQSLEKNSENNGVAPNGLCKLCNINQQLKIQQLAHFVPVDEEDFDEEVEQFRQQLENSYRLCSQCERTLEETLQNQQYNLLKNRLNVQREKNVFLKLNGVSSYYEYRVILVLLRRTLCSGLKLISGTISSEMFLSFLLQFETEQHFFQSTLPDISFLDNLPILQDVLQYLTYSYKMRKEFISIGLLCYALSSFFREAAYDHPSLLLFWGILYVASWSDLTVVQMIISLACVTFAALEVRRMPSYQLKKLPMKRRQEEPKPFPEEPLGRNEGASLKQQEIRSDLIERKEEGETRIAEKSPRKDSRRNEEEVETISGSNCSRMESNRMTLRSHTNKKKESPKKTVFNQKFLSSLGRNEVEKQMSPPPEIFHNLNNLHIGSDSGSQCSKPANFLFENHNFESKSKRNGNIIKSPKFVKPNVNSWVMGNAADSNETLSRSSTPSSGYSSQKPEKSPYEYPKVVSPVPVIQTESPRGFDFYDRTHPCFNSGNCHHYFPPGCMTFPNSMGHTTVYTYTRPTNFPFPFSPSPNSYSFSPSNSRFSDSSEPENLFQNASKSHQFDRRWSTIKSFLYNLSVFFNVITTCALAYFMWSGIISLTGN